MTRCRIRWWVACGTSGGEMPSRELSRCVTELETLRQGTLTELVASTAPTTSSSYRPPPLDSPPDFPPLCLPLHSPDKRPRSPLPQSFLLGPPGSRRVQRWNPGVLAILAAAGFGGVDSWTRGRKRGWQNGASSFGAVRARGRRAFDGGLRRRDSIDARQGAGFAHARPRGLASGSSDDYRYPSALTTAPRNKADQRHPNRNRCVVVEPACWSRSHYSLFSQRQDTA